ncbi:hypothetical protein CLOM_g1745, partial [Closterium sp. NIES-68]
LNQPPPTTIALPGREGPERSSQ